MPANEAERLAALRRYRILDTPADEAFDDVVKLAVQIAGTTLAAISLVDRQRQWFKASVGFSETESARDSAICAHAIIEGNRPFIVPDLTKDPRFQDNPRVRPPNHVRFYAGFPLLSEDGFILGVLCVLDHKPRVLRTRKIEMLSALARQTMRLLQLHRQQIEAQRVSDLLRERESKLTEAMKLARLGSWEHDLESDLFTFNDQFYAITATDYEREEGYRTPAAVVLDNFIPPEDRSILEAEKAKALESSDPHYVSQFEHRMIRRDGALRHMLVRFGVVRDAAGHAIKTRGISLDVTERKQASEQLRKLWRAVEQSPVSVVITDAAGTIEYVNPRFVEVTGYPAAAALGQNPRILKSGTHPVSFYQELWHTLAQGNIWQGEIQNRRKSGELFWESMRISPVRDDAGKITNFIALKEDITERKRLENALQESNRRQEAILNNIPDPAWMKDPQGRYLTVNPAWCRLFGVTPEQVIGKDNRSVHASETLRQIEWEDQQVLEHGRLQVELRIPTAAGAAEWFEVSRSVLSDGNGNCAGIVGIARNISHRKEVEEQLQRKTALLEAQLNTTTEAVLVVNEAGRKILHNQRFVEMFAPPQNVADDPDDEQQLCWVVGVVKDPDPFLQKVRHLYAHPGDISRDEIELRNGVILDRYSAPLVGKGGQNYGRIWTFRDITERKGMEQSLLKSEQRYRLLFELESDAVFLGDIESQRILDANESAQRLYGYSREEFLQLRMEDVSDEPENTRISMANNETRVALRWHRKKSGERFAVEITASQFECDGRLVRLAAVRDITERRLAEEVLEERLALRERLAKIAANAPGVIYAYRLRPDGSACLPYVSPNVDDFYGVRAEEVCDDAAPLFRVIHADDQPQLQQSILHSATTLAPWRMEFRVRHPRRGVFWVEAQATPERETDGSILWHGFASDITERKKAAEQLMLAKDAADSANHAKSEFLAAMSHEIRTPMNGLIGFTDLLLETSLSEEQRQFVETIQSSGKTLINLINDILDLSKIEAGKLAVAKIGFSLSQLVSDVVSLLAEQARKKNLLLQAEYDPVLPHRVVGDPDRVRQVLLNLVGNAIKFTKSGSVRIAIQPLTGFLRCDVSDTGIGIPQELYPLLFREFSQAVTPASRHIGGTGLGLAISKRLLDLLGGKIGFNSEYGKGSTFWFSLPAEIGGLRHEPLLHKNPLHPLLPAGPPSSPTGPAPLRILLVEDEGTSQKLMLCLLRGLSCQVDLAVNGIEAIQWFSRHPYDLVLMDCLMPELDGWQATRQIRGLGDHGAAVPIIATTASLMPDQRHDCHTAGMDDILEKPVHQEALKQMIAKWAPHRAPNTAHPGDGDAGSHA